MSDQATSFRKGSTQTKTIEVGHIRIIEATFPPHATLESHYHGRAGCSVVLEGALEKEFGARTYTAPTAGIITMPPEERHRARFSREGAHLLIVEPGAMSADNLGACAGVLGRVDDFRDARMARIAWQICGELRTPDATTPLVIEGLALVLLALAGRRLGMCRDEPSPPPWMTQAREVMHDCFSSGIGIGEVAQIVGVHPVHLARVFRQFHGVTPGEYLRKVRLEWATAQLIASARLIGDIALQAGYADQSHFTRAFKRHTGVTPGEYRRQVRR